MLEGRGCDLARYGQARWVWWGSGADCRGRGAGRHKVIRAAPHGGGTARITVRLRTSENARLKPPCNRIRR